MTKQEQKKLTAASKRAAQQDYYERLMSLDYFECADQTDFTDSSFAHQQDRLVDLANLAKANELDSAFIERRDELKTILTLPHVIVWQEWTDETEEDPVSGNPRQKVITRREAQTESAAAAVVREAFVKALLSLVAMARRIESGTYAALREVYLRVNAVALRQASNIAFDEDWTEGVFADIEQILPDLKADVDIYHEMQSHDKEKEASHE